MTDLPASVIKFPKPGHASYQEALRAQRDCQLERPNEVRRAAVLIRLKKAIAETYAEFGPDEACGTVTWTHNDVHTDYVKK